MKKQQSRTCSEKYLPAMSSICSTHLVKEDQHRLDLNHHHHHYHLHQHNLQIFTKLIIISFTTQFLGFSSHLLQQPRSGVGRGRKGFHHFYLGQSHSHHQLQDVFEMIKVQAIVREYNEEMKKKWELLIGV